MRNYIEIQTTEPGSSNNRTFIVAVIILGLIFFLVLGLMGGYLAFLRPQAESTRAADATEAILVYAQATAFATLTEAAQSPALAELAPQAFTFTPTQAITSTLAPAAAHPQGEVSTTSAVPLDVAQTATVAALLTQAATMGQPTAAIPTALPTATIENVAPTIAPTNPPLPQPTSTLAPTQMVQVTQTSEPTQVAMVTQTALTQAAPTIQPAQPTQIAEVTQPVQPTQVAVITQAPPATQVAVVTQGSEPTQQAVSTQEAQPTQELSQEVLPTQEPPQEVQPVQSTPTAEQAVPAQLTQPVALVITPLPTATLESPALPENAGGEEMAAVATPTALPRTGFAERVGIPGLIGLAIASIIVIFVVRRVRASTM